MPAQARPKEHSRSRGPSANPMLNPAMEPLTVADLNKRSASAIDMTPAQHSVKRWCTSAENLFVKAQEAKLSGDIDNHYVLLLRGVSIAVDIIPKHLDFNKNDPSYRKLRSGLDELFEELERLKSTINDRHKEWVATQSRASYEQNNSTSEAGVSQDQGVNPVISPRTSSIRSRQSSIGRMPSSNSIVLNGSGENTKGTTANNEISSRFKALQNSTQNSAVSRQPPQKFATANGALNAFPSARTSALNTVPTNISLPIPNNSSASASFIEPPRLSRAESGSGSGSFKLGPLPDKMMSAVELHAGLVSLGPAKSGNTKVLILDVRPMEDYIQGHLRWPMDSIGGNDLESSLVHIEPEWVHAGIKANDILEYMKGFNSIVNDSRIMMFEYRHMFDLIVVYDANSSSLSASDTLQHLVSALFLTNLNGGKSLKQQPVVLQGGFNGWRDFCKRKGPSCVANFIEIGDGVGGGGPLVAGPTPTTPSVSPVSNVSNTSNLPLQSSLRNPSVYGFGKTSLEQREVDSIGWKENRKPDSFSLSRNAFDDPFIGMGVGTNSLLRLLPQTGSMSPSFSRQPSFNGAVEYPSLAQLKQPVQQMMTSPPVPTKAFSPPTTIQQFAVPQPPQPTQQSLHQQPQQQYVRHQLSQQSLGAQSVQVQSQTYPASLSQNVTQMPPPTPPKPVQAIAKKLPPPIPAKPRLSITSVELTQQSPAYSNPNDFISLSQLGDTGGIVGLKNLGNTCFMNSTLQCLSGTVPLSRYFLGGNYRKSINRSNPMGTKGVIAEEFARVIKSMWSGEETVVTPAQFKEQVGEFNPQFKGTDQHDSQEFLAYLLDSIHEDLNIARGPKAKQVDTKAEEDETVPDDIRLQMAWNNYRATNWSIIVDLFQGQYKSKLECLTCKQTSTTFNPFMYLSVPIPPQNSAGVKGGPVYLDECLEKFVEEEILDGEDAWSCPRCKVKRRSRKTLTIAKLPPILLIHLKRFYFQGPFKSKLETYVDFPLADMDLGKYVAPSSTKPESLVYDLYAISVSLLCRVLET
ncbi:ubiquitin-specific protease doa4 [Entophlyctis sp. JEL0112]|nr:ubiquitin-specific protease doa4 [Entophlyctis sp. JEL0112]